MAAVSESACRVEVADMLFAHHANVNLVGQNGFTPLHLASEQFAVESARWLVEHGANLRQQDDNGRTPLQVAQDSLVLLRDWSYLGGPRAAVNADKECQAHLVIEYLQHSFRERAHENCLPLSTEQAHPRKQKKKESIVQECSCCECCTEYPDAAECCCSCM